MCEKSIESLGDGEVLAVESEQHGPHPQISADPQIGPDPQIDADPARIQLLSLDPAFISIELIANWIFTGCVLVGGLVVVIVIAFSFGLLSLFTQISVLIYLIVGAFLGWLSNVLPRKAYQHSGWCLTPSGLEIRRGIWWRSQISVPLARVQHTDVHQGPLMRRFGLAKLIVHTAGTEHSAVELNGLSFATAQRLRDALVENRGEIDGV